MGTRRIGTKLVRNNGHRTQRTEKRTELILFTSCEGPSLDRVWQFPTDSEQTIIIWRETDVSRGTGMCLNIICNLYIACVKYMCINSGIYSPVYNIYCGEWGNSLRRRVYPLHTDYNNIFEGVGSNQGVDQYIFILYKRITRFSCEYSVTLTVLWNLNMHICISISIHSLFNHVLRCTITIQCTRIYVHMFQMRAQFILCK